MTRILRIGSLALLCAALGTGVAVWAGGGHDCGGKTDATSAKAAKHECNMSAEACAQEMQKNLASRGWLGIVMDTESEDTAMTITKVYAGSPAEQAGFHTGDKIVSINGVAANEKNDEKLHAMLKKSKAGDSVTYIVSRDAQDVTLKATLAQIPQDVLADLVNQHLKADHQVAKN